MYSFNQIYDSENTFAVLSDALEYDVQYYETTLDLIWSNTHFVLQWLGRRSRNATRIV